MWKLNSKSFTSVNFILFFFGRDVGRVFLEEVIIFKPLYFSSSLSSYCVMSKIERDIGSNNEHSFKKNYIVN